MNAGPAILEVLAGTDGTIAARLSAVLVISGPLTGGLKALRHLAAQTAVRDIELILASDSRDTLEAALPVLEPFAAARRVLADVTRLPAVRAGSVALARAPFVGFTEDHSFPGPTWAAELIASFESSPHVLAVSPALHNPNPRFPASRAQFSAYFGRFRATARAPGAYRMGALPWHNTAYRRDALIGLGEELAALLAVEGFLQQRLLQGDAAGRFLLNTSTATSHVNVSRLLPACHQSFLGGRLFAAARSHQLEWSLPRRVLQTLASPLVPVVRLARDRAILAGAARGPGDGLNLWLHALVMAVCHAAGEGVGNLLGVGDSIAAYSDFECRRSRFVQPSDATLLEE